MSKKVYYILQNKKSLEVQKILEFNSEKDLENSNSPIDLVDCDLDSFIYFQDQEEKTSFDLEFRFPDQTMNVDQRKIQQESEVFDIQDWKAIFRDENELIPTVTVDPEKKVLMQAFCNRESIVYALENQKACYFSRSRNRLWVKGEESGHFQKISTIAFSKKNRFFVYSVEQSGAACHTGNYSCYFREFTGWNSLPVSL